MGDVAIRNSASPLKRAGVSDARHLYAAHVAGPSSTTACAGAPRDTRPPHHCRATVWHTAAAARHMPYAPADACARARAGRLGMRQDGGGCLESPLLIAGHAHRRLQTCDGVGSSFLAPIS